MDDDGNQSATGVSSGNNQTFHRRDLIGCRGVSTRWIVEHEWLNRVLTRKDKSLSAIDYTHLCIAVVYIFSESGRWRVDSERRWKTTTHACEAVPGGLIYLSTWVQSSKRLDVMGGSWRKLASFWEQIFFSWFVFVCFLLLLKKGGIQDQEDQCLTEYGVEAFWPSGRQATTKKCSKESGDIWWSELSAYFCLQTRTFAAFGNAEKLQRGIQPSL